MLTSEEVQALDAILEDAIVRSKEEDDGDPVFHEVDAKGVNPFADRRTQSDEYTSQAGDEGHSVSLCPRAGERAFGRFGRQSGQGLQGLRRRRSAGFRQA